MNTTMYGLNYLGPSINACADPEGGQGVRTPPPPPPEKSQKYRVS